MIGRRLGPAVVALFALTVVACGGEDDRPEVDGTVLQPDRPGDPVEELDEAPDIEPAEANDADVHFAQMMIPHHAQALEMSELAPQAGGSEKVKTLADRIEGAQRPEILYLAGWLEDLGHQAPTRQQIEDGDLPKAHDHGGGDGPRMEGMATDAQMKALAEARGVDFDTLFLQLMIRHHEGALTMVSDVLRDGSEQQLNKLAGGISSDQQAEITRMKEILADLG
ncbi:DUF305 domain-containing protein [Aeromicrobium sp. CTD01-1L150]|uniref:DUF305 domain-containing protein n=1 Tax=Aeromicrobium sp. CTD01-1L150 TaxID=3341830 RepID=UPI0035BF02D0